jgi:hypothetical protein
MLTQYIVEFKTSNIEDCFEILFKLNIEKTAQTIPFSDE